MLGHWLSNFEYMGRSCVAVGPRLQRVLPHRLCRAWFWLVSREIVVAERASVAPFMESCAPPLSGPSLLANIWTGLMNPKYSLANTPISGIHVAARRSTNTPVSQRRTRTNITAPCCFLPNVLHASTGGVHAERASQTIQGVARAMVDSIM
ncbi:hypothetical protein FKP32DRAFT_1312211 [Trametes sanguinea]|nr:hypothetical protein FKP32DRAFT_1312211 [Trametes sanguinea]